METIVGDDPALVFSPTTRISGLAGSSAASLVDGITWPGARNTADSDPPTSVPPSSAAETTASRINDANLKDFFVDVPLLSKDEREMYQTIAYRTSNEISEDENEPVEVLGELTSRGKRALFVRHEDGIVRKWRITTIQRFYKDLLDGYEELKERDQLRPFDPSASYVHPKDRVTRSGQAPHLRNYSDDASYSSGANALGDVSSASEESQDDSDDSDELQSRRPVTRHVVTQRIKKLPYSPRKTRAGLRDVGSTAASSDGEPFSNSEAPRRRLRKRSDIEIHSSDGESEIISDSDLEVQQKVRGPRQLSMKGPRPEYGHIRNVELGYHDDPDIAALYEHRSFCEKCRRPPAHVLLKRKGRRRRRKGKSDEDELSESEEARRLGGWVRCLKCCIAAHWGCLAPSQRSEIIKAVRTKADSGAEGGVALSTAFRDLEIHDSTEFTCNSCLKGGLCMICGEIAVESKEAVSCNSQTGEATNVLNVAMALDVAETDLAKDTTDGLLFRCVTCKRLAHYSHLSVERQHMSPAQVAEYYQIENEWQCSNCATYTYALDKIIAWRHDASGIRDPYVDSVEVPNYKLNLPREYLVKWMDRSYRRTEWVPHMWLASTSAQKLKNFYMDGPKVKLLERPVKDGAQATLQESTPNVILDAPIESSRDASVDVDRKLDDHHGPPEPMSDAEQRISPLWKTVDRVLDVLLWSPNKLAFRERKKRIQTENSRNDGDVQLSPEVLAEYNAAWELGEQPSYDRTETIDEFERRTRRRTSEADIGKVIWAFIKWDDLPYDESTWDTPPRVGTFGYADFERAFQRFLRARTVVVHKKSKQEINLLEKRDEKTKWISTNLRIPDSGDYDIGQDTNLKLMPFQIEGVNWLCRNWFYHQQCILADEMGLGKTIQIITFLGLLHVELQVFPALVVVPNSTVTNWVREFARWAPGLRVVPFHGEQKSRDIIKRYELQHELPASGTTGAKYHVLVTTYETITATRDFSAVFKKNPRWEVLVVDEGQRLKSDSNMIFRRLNELHSCHRVLMTGTPLNNNIRELFNLMNFLNPDDWNDLASLAKEFEELDEERVKELHERLRPYFLRRVKADVLQLPPKNEIIVPLSMTPLQKEVYKSILSKNLEILHSLSGSSSARLNKSAVNKSNLRNMLMQLRKCLQHPYLIADDIEPKGLSSIETHQKLIDASGKLRFLKLLLPKLQARGHRVLLFSQFVIALDIIEDFLQGEGYKFLRLDGNVKQSERQKCMDDFNREGSDTFIFILSTRAGGVGINLWSADTVIIFDPDFNPHQDLQAIARAHRYGQKRTCLVFKFMTKDSAEEKIFQTAKKKLILDHLIVQKMDDEEDASGIQSILTYGAKMLFDETEGATRDVNYSEGDIDKLVEKVEQKGEQQPGEQASANNAFSFAKIWSAHKDELDEVEDEVESAEQADAWAQTLQKIAEERERAKTTEQAGRGVRRKAALVKMSYAEDNLAEQRKKLVKRKRRTSESSGNDDGEYKYTEVRSRSSSVSTTALNREDVGEIQEFIADVPNSGFSNVQHAPAQFATIGLHQQLLPGNREASIELCGLCATFHGPGACVMTNDSRNLAEYRKYLLISREEPYETRAEAIRAIDETLMRRRQIHLIQGQSHQPSQHQVPIEAKAGMDIALGNSNLHSSAAPSRINVGVPSTNNVTPSSTVVTASKPLKFVVQNHYVLTQPVSKKVKIGQCEICQRAPYHQPSACPVVAQGPTSITKAIARLTNEGGSQETLQSLRILLRKQKREMEDIQSRSAHTDTPASQA